MKDIIVLTELEIKILIHFTGDYNLKISILQLAKRLKIHYPNIYNTIKSLEKRNLIILEVVGKASICSLNKKSLELPVYLAYAEKNQANEIIKKFPIIDRIARETIKIGPNNILGIFGSHVTGNAGKQSDIDIFLITDNRKGFIDLIPRNFPQYEKKIDFNIISFEEFTESLNTKKLTISSEIIKNKILIYGAEIYYNIMLQKEL